MEGHRDITEMSFEEFFSDPKAKAERSEPGKQAAPQPAPAKVPAQKTQNRGFSGAGPKMNYTAGRFQMYIPRYTGDESSRFEAAIDCAAGIIPMGQLGSAKQKGGRTTRPATLDLTTVGVSPLEQFTLTIDGDPVYVNSVRKVLFFNNIGLPMNRPAGDVFAVHDPSVRLRLVKAEVLDETVRDGIKVTHLDVSLAGGVWIDDSQPAEAPAQEAEAPEPEQTRKPAAKKAAPKKVRVKGSLSVPAGCRDLDVRVGDEALPVYTEPFQVSVSVDGCPMQECLLRISAGSGDAVSAAPEPVSTVDLGDAAGPADLVLEKDGKVLDSRRVFLLPGFAYAMSGKGDLTDDPSVGFTLFGEDMTADLSESNLCGPFEHDGVSFSIEWMLPVVEYDLGSGARRDIPCDIDASELKGDSISITVRGARKKSVFFGGERGKKRDVTPDWTSDTYEIPLAEILDEVYSNPSSVYCFYITVNSFPNRKFMTIRNPVRIKASYSEGTVTVDIDPSVDFDCVCRLYRMDRSETEVPVSPGVTTVPVDADVIEAEVVETVGGRTRISVPVTIRGMPFLVRGPTGDYWMYVSRSKRIPLPDGLIVGGKADQAAVKAWHDRIVRMNPELKSVTYQMMQKAFSEIGE